MTARFEIVRTDAAQWHARFRAANGRVVWTTETYAWRDAALLAVLQVAKPLTAPPHVGMVSLSPIGEVEVREVDERTEAQQ